jgi:lipoprotein-anchoring transpeptidase ErfK/SrfK
MRGDPGASDGRRVPSTTRPRYDRISAAGVAALVTLVAVLGGLGVLPTAEASASARPGAGVPASSTTRLPAGAASTTPSAQPPSTPGAEPSRGAIALAGGVTSSKPSSARTAGQDAVPGVPADSGSGRRVVFDMTHQRVWLVGRHAGHDVVRRTYLVSGSVTGNLRPGSYAVYSKSMDAVGVDDSGTMHYMVRFAHGGSAAIGFHDIPVWNGARVQTRDALGTPQSHGCIRQWRPDARALWRFTSVGSKVVAVA